MTATFLVHVNIVDVTTISDEAARIQEDLESAGHDVESVEPWARPTTSSITLPTVPLPSPPNLSQP